MSGSAYHWEARRRCNRMQRQAELAEQMAKQCSATNEEDVQQPALVQSGDKLEMYPTFMEGTMDHFHRSNVFFRWFKDDYLTSLPSGEAHSALERFNNDPEFRGVIEDRFLKQVRKKARNHDMYLGQCP